MIDMNEPIRHHYIPQFILRNFCSEAKRLCYYDKSNGCVAVKETKDVFMTPYLYSDDINHPVDRARIERDFASYEREMSELINGPFVNDSDIIISIEDEEKLKLFLTLMGFRSRKTSEFFGTGAKADNKRFYLSYQHDGNLQDLWKRNLGYLVNCRSLKDVIDHPHIDEPIKLFMIRDDYGYFGKHFSVVECCEPYEFVIGDAYPTVVRCELSNGLSLDMYSIFPISPKRAIIIFSIRVVDEAPSHILVIRRSVFNNSYKVGTDYEKIRVKRIDKEDFSYVNRMISDSAIEGIVFRSHDKEKLLLDL